MRAAVAQQFSMYGLRCKRSQVQIRRSLKYDLEILTDPFP